MDCCRDRGGIAVYCGTIRHPGPLSPVVPPGDSREFSSSSFGGYGHQTRQRHYIDVGMYSCFPTAALSRANTQGMASGHAGCP